MRVGVDIGGTKMLMLAQSEADCARRQIATGDRFSGADATAEIVQFIQTLPTPTFPFTRCYSRFRSMKKLNTVGVQRVC